MEGYNLSLVLKGTAVFKNPLVGPIEVGKGHCLLVFPGQEYTYTPQAGELWEEWWCQFHGPYIQLLEKEGSISPLRPLFRTEDIAPLVALFKKGFALGRRKSSMDMKRLPAVAFNLLHELIVAQPSAMKPVDTRRPAAIIAQAMRQSPEKNWNFRDLAKNHGISHPYLFKQFQSLFQISPLKYLTREKMKLATLMLTNGLSVAETCYQVGMKDPYYFSRLYKKTMGKPPSKVVSGYRGQLQRVIKIDRK